MCWSYSLSFGFEKYEKHIFSKNETKKNFKIDSFSSFKASIFASFLDSYTQKLARLSFPFELFQCIVYIGIHAAL